MRELCSFDYSKEKPNRFAGRFGEEAIAVVVDPDVAQGELGDRAPPVFIPYQV